jgi:tetratricopeptide (TPR) repeat protein
MADKSARTKAAQAFAAKGQIDKAIAEWESLLKESPDGNTYNIVGDLYLKKRAKNKAVEAFSSAAHIFREDGFYHKAIAIYKKILHISPLEVDALTNLAELNAEKGLIGSANENFSAAAEIHLKGGYHEQALEIYEKMLKLTPSNFGLKLKIAEMYLKIGLQDEAAKEYGLVASDYFDKGEQEKALELFNKAIEISPQNVSAFLGLSRISESTGDIDKACEYLDKVLSFAPDNSDVLFNYARLSIDRGELDRAKQALMKLVEIEPSNNLYKKLLGSLYLKEGLQDKAWEEMHPYIDEAISKEKWSETLELMENFKEIDPFEIKGRLVAIYKGMNDNDSAVKELKSLAGICESKNLAKDALQLCQEILELNPADADVMDKIKELEKKLGIKEPSLAEKPVEEVLPEVDAYIHQGLLTEAEGLLRSLAKKEPENLDIHKKLKDVYIQQGEREKAVDECLVLANLNEKSGDIEAKNTVIAEAISLRPDDPRLAAISKGEEIEVAAPGQEAESPVEKSGANLDEQLAEADFYAQQGLNDEAVRLYEKLLSKYPDNETVKNKLNSLKPSEVSEGKPAEEGAEKTSVEGDLKDIFHEFKKGIDEEIGEKDGESRYNLGIAYKEMGLLDDAIKEFKISAKDSDKALQSASMLAVCYMDKKLYPLAIQEFQKVTELMKPSDKGFLGAKCDLADAYVKNKNYNKALKLYMEVYAQNPKFKDVERKIKIIKSMPPEDKDKPKTKKDRVSYI